MSIGRVMGGTVAARALQSVMAFLTTFLLAIWYAPGLLGTYVVAIAAAAILQYACSYWLATAVLRDAVVVEGAERLDQRTVDRFAICLAVAGAVISAVLLIITRASEIGLVGAAALAILVAEAWFSSSVNRALASNKPGLAAILCVSRGLATPILTLSAAAGAGAAWGALLGYALAAALPVLLPRRGGAGQSVLNSLSAIGAAFRAYFPMSVGAVIRQTFDRGDRLAVASLFGIDAAGVYGLAADAVRRPVQILAGSSQAILAPALARAHDRLASSFRLLWRINGQIVILISLSATLAAVALTDIVFVRWTGKFPEALTQIACILGLSASLEAIETTHITQALVLSGKTTRLPLVHLSAAAFFAVALSVVHAAGLGAAEVAVVVATANALSCAGMALLSRSILKAPFDWGTSIGALGYYGVVAGVLLVADQARGGQELLVAVLTAGLAALPIIPGSRLISQFGLTAKAADSVGERLP